MLIMNRPAVPTFLFIEFSEQAHFTGWVWRVIYMRADTALARVNQLSYTTEPGTGSPTRRSGGKGKNMGGRGGRDR